MSFDAAMARILSITGTRTQVELAEQLGIRQSSISDAKRRQSIPDAWLISLYRLRQANPDWIMTGEGMPYLVMDTSRGMEGMAAVPMSAATAKIQEPAKTLDELLAPARAMAGPGLKILVVPAGSRVTVDEPLTTDAMDNLESAEPQAAQALQEEHERGQ